MVELHIDQLAHHVVLVECVVDMLYLHEFVLCVEKLDIVEPVEKHVVDMLVMSVGDRLVVVVDNRLELVDNTILLQESKNRFY